MLKLTLSKSYSKNFVQYVKDLFVKMIKSDLSNNKYLIKYIEENYNIKINDFLAYLKNSFLVSIDNKYIYIIINENKYINNYKLSELINLIDYGNRDVKGINSVNKIINSINKDIFSYYILYISNIK